MLQGARVIARAKSTIGETWRPYMVYRGNVSWTSGSYAMPSIMITVGQYELEV
jgi:hypothetical protein